MITGEQIKHAREEKNLSQEELSELLKVSRQAVSKWENGLSVPQGENRRRLMEVLQLGSAGESCAAGETEDQVEENLPESSLLEEKADRARRSSRVGWAVAIFLLAALVATWIFQYQSRKNVPLGQPGAGDENLHIQFYDSEQKPVFGKDSCYNAAKIDSILVQWDGEGAKSVDMYCQPEGFPDAVMILTQAIPAGSSAILLSGQSLSTYMQGQIFLKLKFEDRVLVSEKYDMCYDPMIYAYIREFDGRSMVFDEVEWVETPGERATELGLVDEASGFVVYNEKEDLREFDISKDCTCTMLDWSENFVETEVPPEELAKILEERDAPNIPYILTIEGGQITQIQEKYVP